MLKQNLTFYLFFKGLIDLERGRERERQGEEHQHVVAPHAPPTGDLVCNPDVCPDWESNQRPFGSQASTQSTELYQLGLIKIYFNKLHYIILYILFM